MKISYLIPLYNHADFVQETIHSVMREATSAHPIEICVCDDGSNDGSADVVAAITPLPDTSIRLLRHPMNRGKVAALNTAFAEAHGDFIFIVGSDDVVTPGRTRRMLEESERTGRSVCGGFVMRNQILGEDLGRLKPVPPNRDKILIENKYGGGCLGLMRVDADRCFPIPASLPFEDWWLAFQLVRGGRLTVIPDVVLVYRIHGGNAVGAVTRSVDSVARDFRRHEAYFDEFERQPLDAREQRLVRRARAIRHAFRGERSVASLLSRPLDLSYVLLLGTWVGGPRGYLAMTRWRSKWRRIVEAARA